MGIIGVIVVFVSVFLRIYCNQRLRAIRNRTQASSGSKVWLQQFPFQQLSFCFCKCFVLLTRFSLMVSGH